MKLNHGVNLGGFLSQCVHTEDHYDTFIVEDDIKKIAADGYDHIRVPVDYNVLETDAGEKIVRGFTRIKTLYSWAVNAGLDMVFDLHKAYGYDFNNAGDSTKNNLFNSSELQERFVNLWSEIAREFSSCEHLAFELLNEVVEKDNAEAWNQLIERTVSEIRKYSARPIIYGGIQWNSAGTLKLLRKPQFPNIIYTFHFYEPLIFTHQKAYWIPSLDPSLSVRYPESMDYYRDLSREQLGEQGETVINATSSEMGTGFMEEMILEAIKAAEAAGVPLYCGEFGVIDQAPLEDAARWFKDVYTVFDKYHIGNSIWTYKQMDFEVAGRDYLK